MTDFTNFSDIDSEVNNDNFDDECACADERAMKRDEKRVADRFVRAPFADANHYIYSDDSLIATDYQRALRQVCFTSDHGVYRAKTQSVAKKVTPIAPFETIFDNFFYPNSEEAITNRHLFDACGDNVLRIVDENFQLLWTRGGVKCEIDDSELHEQETLYTSVLCHREKNISLLVDFNGQIIALHYETGKLIYKSEKILGENFVSPSIAWYDNSIVAMATGRQAFLYDLLSEKKIATFPVSEKIKTIAPCSLKDACIVAVLYENSTINLFDTRNQVKPLKSLDCNAMNIDWQPNSKKLGVVNIAGKIELFNACTNFFESLQGLPESNDTTGLYWNDQDSLFLTSRQESGFDRVDYFEKNAIDRFCNEFRWSPDKKMLCTRVDRQNKRFYASTNTEEIYYLELPERSPCKIKKLFNQSALVSSLR